jgi:hypothetical protein
MSLALPQSKTPKPRRPKRLETDRPRLSDATIDRVRAFARQYVRAGGSIFPSSTLTDVDEHIGNVGALLQGRASHRFAQALEETDFTQVDDQPRLSNLAAEWVSEDRDAAFLFGAFVGLELAALTVGPVAVTIPAGRTARRKRGGTR